jgi:hypothetical protein
LKEVNEALFGAEIKQAPSYHRRYYGTRLAISIIGCECGNFTPTLPEAPTDNGANIKVIALMNLPPLITHSFSKSLSFFPSVQTRLPDGNAAQDSQGSRSKKARD